MQRAARAFAPAAVAAAIFLGGCGVANRQPTSQTGAASVGAPHVQSLSAVSAKPASRHLLTEVNTVCRAVRQDAPSALRAPYTPAGVGRYASAATLPTRRTLVSLQRLTAVGGASSLQPIVGSYSQLQAAYQSAPLVANTAHGAQQLGAQIQARETAVTAAARAAGAPACGIAGH
jgi:hypothetical protein